MIAAILCPGPSLRDTCPTDEQLKLFDLVIAVNRAILLRPGIEKLIHWHACGDWDTLYAINRKPAVGICSQRDVYRITVGGGKAPEYAHLQWHIWEELGVAPGYSTISALALAHKLGENTVMVFGDDKMGREDWDGATGRNRKDERWVQEKMLQDRAVAKLGLKVSYIRPKAVV